MLELKIEWVFVNSVLYNDRLWLHPLEKVYLTRLFSCNFNKCYIFLFKWFSVCLKFNKFGESLLSFAFDLKINDSLWLVYWIRPTDQVDSQPSCQHSIAMKTAMIVQRPKVQHDDGVDDLIGRYQNLFVYCYCYCWAIGGGGCCWRSCYFAVLYSIRWPIYYYLHLDHLWVFLMTMKSIAKMKETSKKEQ